MKQFFFLLVSFVLLCMTPQALAGPIAPVLSYTTSGTNLFINWTNVPGATGYELYYAPHPYTGEESIRSLDLGNKTNVSYSLSVGAAYHFAVTAYSDQGRSSYSNIELFSIESNNPLSGHYSGNISFEMDDSFSPEHQEIIRAFHNKLGLMATSLYGNDPVDYYVMHYLSNGHPGWDYDRSDWFVPWNPDHRYNSMIDHGYGENTDFFWFYTNEIIQLFQPEAEVNFLEQPGQLFNAQMVYRLGENLPQAATTILIATNSTWEYDYIKSDYIGMYNAYLSTEWLKTVDTLKPSTVYSLTTNYDMNPFAIDIAKSVYVNLYDRDNGFFIKLFDNFKQGFDGTEQQFVDYLVNSCNVEMIHGVPIRDWIESRGPFQRDDDNTMYSIDILTKRYDQSAPMRTTLTTSFSSEDVVVLYIVGHSSKNFYEDLQKDLWDVIPDTDFFGKNVEVKLYKNGRLYKVFEAPIMTNIDNQEALFEMLPTGDYLAKINFNHSGDDLSEEYSFTVR